MIDNSFIEEVINLKQLELTELSEKIWEYSELSFYEQKSSTLLKEYLKKEGFIIEDSISLLPTAFIASFGNKGPTIALLGEYDALPNLSQEASLSMEKPLISSSSGHGCGHNLLGVGSLAAALIVKKYLEVNNIEGTIKYFGCPAEEIGSGKTFMVRDGFFKDVDIALSWHPSDMNCVLNIPTLANLSVFFKFTGQKSHAGISPHLGRSALDAVELMNIGANYLREHVTNDVKFHYAYIDTGGTAPNVVQSDAKILYYIRAKDVNKSIEIFNRLSKIANGAALMTETNCEIIKDKGLSNYIPNQTIGKLLNDSFIKFGAPKFDDLDINLAKKFRSSFSKAAIDSSLSQAKLFQGEDIKDLLVNKPLSTLVGPFKYINSILPGSTDVGDVSQVVPTGQIIVASTAIGTIPHTWQFTAQSSSSIGFKGMLQAGKILADTSIILFNNPKYIKLAKDELNKKTNGQYICPINLETLPLKNIKKGD